MNPVPLTLARLARFGIPADAARAIATAADATTVTINIDGPAWRALLASVRLAKPTQPPATPTPATQPRRMPPPAAIPGDFDAAAERVRLRRGSCCDPPRQ